MEIWNEVWNSFSCRASFHWTSFKEIPLGDQRLLLSDINYFSSDGFFGVHSIATLHISRSIFSRSGPLGDVAMKNIFLVLKSISRYFRHFFLLVWLEMSLKPSAMSMGRLYWNFLKCLARYCYSINSPDRVFKRERLIRMRRVIAFSLRFRLLKSFNTQQSINQIESFLRLECNTLLFIIIKTKLLEPA